MKKSLIILTLFFISSYLFAQESIAQYISVCTSALGNTVPNGFTRLDRTIYKKDYSNATIQFITDDGRVVLSSVGWAFSRTNEAREWLAQYYDFFERQSWQYYGNYYGDDIYKKGTVYASLVQLTRREDGFITVSVVFLKNLSDWIY